MNREKIYVSSLSDIDVVNIPDNVEYLIKVLPETIEKYKKDNPGKTVSLAPKNHISLLIKQYDFNPYSWVIHCYVKTQWNLTVNYENCIYRSANLLDKENKMLISTIARSKAKKCIIQFDGTYIRLYKKQKKITSKEVINKGGFKSYKPAIICDTENENIFDVYSDDHVYTCEKISEEIIDAQDIYIIHDVKVCLSSIGDLASPKTNVKVKVDVMYYNAAIELNKIVKFHKRSFILSPEGKFLSSKSNSKPFNAVNLKEAEKWAVEQIKQSFGENNENI
jgi:hypothetical protein